LILGDWMGGVLSVLAMAALLAFAWGKRKVGLDSPEFVQVLALFFVGTTLVLPLLTPYNQVLLLLPVLMLIREWRSLPRWGSIAFALLVAWPLVVSQVMLVHPPQLESMHRTPLLPSALVLLFPFLLLWFVLARRQREAA